MPTLLIALEDLSMVTEGVDLSNVPESQIAAQVRKGFGFLSPHVEVTVDNGVVTITLPDEKLAKLEEATRLYDRAIKHAQKKDYERAIRLLRLVLDSLPLHTDARRNMAMSYLETGDIGSAKKHLNEVLMLDPKDAWSWVLLGNIYNKQGQDLTKAERMYERAYALKSDDLFLLASYGGLMAKKGNLAKARELFEQAIRVDQAYPNPYVGLALLNRDDDRPDLALVALQSLFRQTVCQDPRSAPVYQQARALCLDVNQRIIEKTYDSMMKTIDERMAQVKLETGFGVQLVEDNKLDVLAISEMAWRHGLPQHRIRYKSKTRLVVPHLLAHELEHISLEHEARALGQNRTFTTSSRTREIALRAVGNHAFKLRQKGYPEKLIADYMRQVIEGVCGRVFNCPLDMIVEYRLYNNHKAIRPAQFVSLNLTHQQAVPEVKNKNIREMTPPHIYSASLALNSATALCIDSFFGGATSYADDYASTDAFSLGKKLFAVWQESLPGFRPGDEYGLIDEFARILKLDEWYEWIRDPSADRQTVTNAELLKAKEPAAIMYCLGALERLEKMDREDVRKVANEIALRGAEGIDYSSSAKDYSLMSLPGETFTGLQLLCLMYVGFKKTDPLLNLGLDLGEPYELALKLHRGKSEEIG
ncbi:MAG: tetratricopeptide repeat protein [Dehalococcoidia bacterium]|nr:tetratricopeptide repeat protein [Dehalococcoidia bacterium]